MFQTEHYGWQDGGMMMGWGLHGFTGLFFFLALVVTVVFILRWLWRDSVGNSRNALSILEERYATGEIDHDEFVSRKKDLD